MSESIEILDQVTTTFLTALQHDARIIQGTAKKLFYDLALIQLTLSALWMSFVGVSLQTLFVRLVQMVLGFSLFYACIEFGSQWVPTIINGFVEIGQQAGINSLSPSAILSQGMSIVGAMFKAFFGWGVLKHPFVSMVGSINCIAIIILYALLAAELAIILVKSYVLVALSSFFFALGANQATRPMTINYIKTIIGIGLKLMTLYFLLGVGQHIGQNWTYITQQASEVHEILPMLAILAAVIVYYMIIKNVPAFIAGLSGVGGFHNIGGSTVATAISAGMQGKRTLAQTGQITAKAAQSSGLAGRAVYQSWKSGKQSHGNVKLTNIPGVTATATGALAKATLKSSRDWVLKHNTHQSMGQRINTHLANKIKERK